MMSCRRLVHALGFALAWGGVGPACVTAPTFRDQPIVWAVDDTRGIPEPAEREFVPLEYYARVFVTRRLTRLLELPDSEPAWNTNALDEVPASSWFNHRIGYRPITPEQAAAGPDGAPPELPLVVFKGKAAGANPGFFAMDAKGRKFLIKFDTPENPEMQTATSVIVNRVFWTLGFNVPSDHVFWLRPGDLRVSPEATYRDKLGSKRPLTRSVLNGILAKAAIQSDGRIRASSSLLLSGVPKGGFAAEGRRPDDANDLIPHEHRRELRGLRVFAAWVGHTDMKEDNSIDMYVEEGGRRFLRHYLIDFGEALAAHGAEKGRLEDGWEHFWDWENQGKALFAMGLWKRPWEDARQTPWRSIGTFSAHPFDPEAFREAYPYWPFFETDEADAYWAAKLIMHFDRAMLDRIVETGKLSQRAAASYLVETLWQRRIIIGRTYLEAVSPLDRFTIEPDRMCMTDLGTFFGIADGGVVERLGEADEVLDRVTLDETGRGCIAVRPADEYRVARLRLRRGRVDKPVMQVHYKGGPRARILGIIRTER